MKSSNKIAKTAKIMNTSHPPKFIIIYVYKKSTYNWCKYNSFPNESAKI